MEGYLQLSISNASQQHAGNSSNGNMSSNGDGFHGHAKELFHHQEPFDQKVGILTCLAVVILLENGCIAGAFIGDKRLRKRSANLLVFSQACADLFTALIFIPTYLTEMHLNNVMVTPFLICYMLFISLANLFALAADRYLALRKPLLHHRVMGTSNTGKILLTIWGVPLALSLIPLFWWFEDIPENAKKAGQVYLSVMWSIMLLLVIGMIVLYIFIASRARKSIKQRKQSLRRMSDKPHFGRRELRVTNLFGLLLFFFIIAYFPILYMNLCDMLNRTDLIPGAFETVSFYCHILNSVVNPVLCIVLKKDYQEAMKVVILRKRRKPRYTSTIISRASTRSTFGKFENQDSESPLLPLNRRPVRQLSLDSRMLDASYPSQPRFRQRSASYVEKNHTDKNMNNVGQMMLKEVLLYKDVNSSPLSQRSMNLIEEEDEM